VAKRKRRVVQKHLIKSSTSTVT